MAREEKDVEMSAASASAPASAAKAAKPFLFVERCRGVNGLEKVVLREAHKCSAEVYLHGAQVTSWKNELGEELLFVSSKAIFQPSKVIRGGISICFPQYANTGVLDGFARNRLWSVEENSPSFPTKNSNRAFVDLILKSSEEDLKIWPHRFELRLRVTLGPGGDLMFMSSIRNNNSDGKPFSFTFSFQNYFSVSDISEVRVEGLETLDYLDKLKGGDRFTEQGDSITFESEIERIYVGTPSKIAILDHERKRTLVLHKSSLPDAVVWNPWDRKAKTLPDLRDDEYKYMLCLQPAAIETPITLKPGQEWKGRQEISVVLSSYSSGRTFHH